MAEVVREQKRSHLKQAESVSISVDDRGEFRLVRYRCSVKLGAGDDGTGWRRGALPEGATDVYEREGVLAVLRKHGNVSGMSLRDIGKDYSCEVKESIKPKARSSICWVHRPLLAAYSDHSLVKNAF